MDGVSARFRGGLLKLSDSPTLRVLTVVVLVAVGIRFVFWLLEPVWPYLLAVLVIWALWQVRLWWLDRW